MNRLALAIGTWFGCGYFPWGPGTAGSIAALILAAFLRFELHAGRGLLLLITLLLLGPGIWAATRTARIMGKGDPGQVVVDEVLGQWITLAGVASLSWKSLLAGLVLFRLFDIWKPWPVRQLEGLPEGVGIIADDVAAGIYGALILYIGEIARLY